MKIVKTSLVLLLGAASLSLHAQSVDEIVTKHINALGGKEIISKVSSIVIEGEVGVMGQTFPSVTTIAVNKGFKNVTNVNGMDIIQVFTPDGGWSVNPLMGSSTPTPVSEEEKKLGSSSYDVGGSLFNYKEKGSTVELAGSDSVNGIKTIRLKVKDKNGVESLLSIDPNTYYVLRQESKGMVNGQEFIEIATFSDYKKTDIGYVMPYTLNRTSQGFEITVTHSKIEFNKEIDPKIFEIPKS